MRALLWMIILALAASACGNQSDGLPTAVDDRIGAGTSSTDGSDPVATVPSDEQGLDDGSVVAYLAAVEDVLAGTAYEGASLEAPDVFVATGVLFCDRLEDGLTPDEVLDEYVVALTDGPTRAAEADVLVMVGGLMGAGVVTLCPQHMALVEDSS